MYQTQQQSRVSRIIAHGLIIFLAAAAVFLSWTLWQESSSVQTRRSTLITDQRNLVNSEQSVISGKVEYLSSDLVYIRDTLDLDGFPTGDFSRLASDWTAFADSQGIYDQIRFIDVDGNEVIRINLAPTGSYSVPAEQLQNKADRYYFADSIGLDDDQIFISKLDLNIEGTAVELPIKPMIRLCMPYHDASGTLRGIVCLNYLAKNDMLSEIGNVASSGVGFVSMLNSDGYWLYNEEDPSSEWAFMYDDRRGESFATKYPDEWSTISQGGSGSLVTENGLFVYSGILTDEVYAPNGDSSSLVLDEGDWTIVTRTPLEGDDEELRSEDVVGLLPFALRKNIPGFVLILALAMTFSLYLDSSRERSRRTAYFADYDEMTGVFNRRAGLEHLEKYSQRRRGGDVECTVCFVDIDDLKGVNDTYGHDAGDNLIMTVVSAMRDNTREQDKIVRMGGDEFLVVFEGLDSAASEQVWDRIARRLGEIDREGTLGFPISASHGIASFGKDASLDEAIHAADARMYEEKRHAKAKG